MTRLVLPNAGRHVRPLLHLAAALAVVVALAGCGSSGDSKTTSSSTTTKPAAAAAIPGAAIVHAEFAGIPQQGEVAGDPKAPWTLEEFGDLQCPACKYYADTTLPAVVAKLVRTGKVRFAMRPFGYVGPDSVPAAAYAWAAAKQDKLHEFARLWYLNQGDENSGYVTDAFARRVASGVVGLDPAQLIRDAKTVPVRSKVQVTSDEFDRRGLKGTPSFIFGPTNGKLSTIDLGDGTGAQAVAAIQAAMG
jgi:protein-disulfide isomerase